jgi:hypothetical protein
MSSLPTRVELVQDIEKKKVNGGGIVAVVLFIVIGAA